MTALIFGTLLALGALSYVLYPLLMSDGSAEVLDLPLTPMSVDAARNEAVDALREIEFDRETGKLSDGDYDSLKASYTQRALTAMRAAGGVECPNCGPRPEASASFCSRCGLALANPV